MKIALLVFLLSALGLGSCAFYGASDASPLAAPSGITTASGAEQARRDLAAGKVQLLDAGTRGVYTPGISFGDNRYANIPHRKLPVACTTPNAGLWVEYAQGYNAVVVGHIKKQVKR